MLTIRYSLSRVDVDLDLAIDTFRSVSDGPGLASMRLRAAMEWAKAAAARSGIVASLDALTVALTILPLVTWPGHRMAIQFKTLRSLSANIGPWAAACAILHGRPEDAVAYLERGRNVLWSQLLAFQGGARKHQASYYPDGTTTTETDSLASYIAERIHGPQPVSAEALEDLKKRYPQIDNFFTNWDSFDADFQPVRRMLCGDFDPTEIRILPEKIRLDASLHRAAQRWKPPVSTAADVTSEDESTFNPLDPISPLAELLADSQGYVVFLNAHSIHCDALIIRRALDGCIGVDHVPLPDLSAEEARSWAQSIQMGMGNLQRGSMRVRDIENVIFIPILRNLWRAVALPVLTHLSISRARDTTPPLTRIWWSLSGPLVFLPLHAAGPYEDDAPGIPELVISSYTPTLSSLINAYCAPDTQFSMLAIGQPETPTMSPLPAVRQELATIERACARISHDLTTLVGPDATDFAVSNTLVHSPHTWLHISCHAHQDPKDPFESALFMHNGPLTLKKLVQLDLEGVQFAFLSACLTSAGDAHLPDECIHLAAGMQFAGVRSVVATLWSVDDRAAAFVTDRFYGAMMKEGVVEPDLRDAAQALHDAVLEMKAAGRPMVFWIPFIHVGI